MKTILIRLLILLLITWALVAQLYFLSAILFFWYAFTYRGYELVMVAILVDGYYQSFYSIPILSLMSLGSVLLIELIKPQLIMYTGKNDVVS